MNTVKKKQMDEAREGQEGWRRQFLVFSMGPLPIRASVKNYELVGCPPHTVPQGSSRERVPKVHHGNLLPLVASGRKAHMIFSTEGASPPLGWCQVTIPSRVPGLGWGFPAPTQCMPVCVCMHVMYFFLIFIYLAAWSLSFSMQDFQLGPVGSSSLTRDWTLDPCTGSTES